MTLRTMQWALFAAMAATVPLLFFAFVVGGFLPLLIIALTLTDPAVLLLGGIHLAVYIPILFFTSRLIAKFILARPEHQQCYIFGGLIGALLLLGLAPLYGASHGQIAFSNVYQIYWEGLNLRYVTRAPEDWKRNWSKFNAGQTLYICTGIVPVPGPSRIRQGVVGWQHEPRVVNQRGDIRWGIEPPAQDKQYLDDIVRKEFERIAPRAYGPIGKLAQMLRHALDSTYTTEPWKYGELSAETLTYYCVSAQYR